MEVGAKRIVTVYLVKGKKVITCYSAGDNYGYVEDIETGERFGTYGYRRLTRVGKVEIITSFGQYFPDKED